MVGTHKLTGHLLNCISRDFNCSTRYEASSSLKPKSKLFGSSSGVIDVTSPMRDRPHRSTRDTEIIDIEDEELQEAIRRSQADSLNSPSKSMRRKKEWSGFDKAQVIIDNTNCECNIANSIVIADKTIFVFVSTSHRCQSPCTAVLPRR